MDDALLTLDLVKGLERRRLRNLLTSCGGAQRLLGQDVESLRRSTGCSSRWATSFMRRCEEAANRVGDERRLMKALGCRLISESMGGYPPLLRLIPDPPVLLRVRGGFPKAVLESTQPSVAVVGSRRPSPHGCRQARRFAEFLVDHGVHLVSGGARGIDAIVHRQAVLGSSATTAVMGSGLGRVYPPEHESLFDSILESGGALVSEFPMRTPPRPAHFPRRNRIVSGLSLGVLVIEATSRSGALITARMAVEDHGREGGALPGRIDDSASQGCLRMIAEGWGALVRSPEEALELLTSPTPLLACREAVLRG
ncbi:MAG: DNA-processing protein DprA [Planctomycetota bacterium]|nr:DNA-processing protein DprA [Planctomycetota bacterium]